MSVNIPGYIPGHKVDEYKDILAAKRGAIGYVPMSPKPVKKEEPKVDKPKKIKE